MMKMNARTLVLGLLLLAAAGARSVNVRTASGQLAPNSVQSALNSVQSALNSGSAALGFAPLAPNSGSAAPAAVRPAAVDSSRAVLPVVPRPAVMEPGEGYYRLPQRVVISVPAGNDSVLAVARRFGRELSYVAGLDVEVKTKARRADLRLVTSATLPAEGYTLDADASGIRIAAATPAGFFYALQTLKQLLPAEMMAGVPASPQTLWQVPQLHVADAPRFGWRGFMLDEGRHFFGKEEVKRVLDIMAAYKMNRFHWHLTEDQGWRIEIKKYPRLTAVGAWRDSKVLPWGSVESDGQRYGGFYTQEDIREVVAYARERFIEIMPEIDMPGHFQAALAAYPELSCDPSAPHGVWVGQGVSTDVMNVVSPAALQFTKDVVDELIALFPFGYLHLGGDECPVTLWKTNAACRARLAELGSEDFRDLQTDFYRRVMDYIAAKPQAERRRLVFWNEVLHGNTSRLADATIMAWVGADKAAHATAARGFDNILSPQIPYYINRKQSADKAEPHSQGSGAETLEAVYAYVPARGVPDSLLGRYRGVQANFWTEWVTEPWHVEYLMLPRLAAVAEAGWTPQEARDYAGFLRRVEPHTGWYRLRGYSYGRHAFGR